MLASDAAHWLNGLWLTLGQGLGLGPGPGNVDSASVLFFFFFFGGLTKCVEHLYSR